MSPINAFPVEKLYTPEFSESLKENTAYWQEPNLYEQRIAWTTEKEFALAKGWHAISENSQHGNARKKDGFWCEVLAYIESKTKQEGRQTYDMESGVGDEDYVQRAMIHYQDETEVPFKFRHCWNVLKDSPKFQEIAFQNFNQGSEGSSKRHKSSVLVRSTQTTLEAIKKKNKPLESHHVGGIRMNSDSGISNTPPLLPLPSANSNLKPNPTTKFVPGHKCEGKIFSLVVLPMKELKEEFENAQKELEELENKELPQISLNAFAGASYYQTMRVIGIKLVIEGTLKSPDEWLTSKKQVQRMDHAQQAEMMMMCVSSNTSINLWSLEKTDSQEKVIDLQTAIDSFEYEIAILKQPPPLRSLNRRIPIIESGQPVIIRHNRHFLSQKDAPAARVKELCIPFASSLVTVKLKGNLGYLGFDIWKWPHRKFNM
ncbi:hypothetical protein Tco_0543513 [Tanacetum coccineum]